MCFFPRSILSVKNPSHIVFVELKSEHCPILVFNDQLSGIAGVGNLYTIGLDGVNVLSMGLKRNNLTP
jgi:hypothetical protein